MVFDVTLIETKQNCNPFRGPAEPFWTLDLSTLGWGWAWFLVLGAWIWPWVGAWKLGVQGFGFRFWGFSICAMHCVLCAISYATLEVNVFCVVYDHIAMCYMLCVVRYMICTAQNVCISLAVIAFLERSLIMF